MKHFHYPTLLALLSLSNAAAAENLLVTVDGMDCVTCQPKVETRFKQVDGVQAVKASTTDGAACVQTSSGVTPSAATFQSSLNDLPNYKVTDVAVIDTCPLGGATQRPGVLWRKTDGLDAQIISTRAEVDVRAAIVSGKFTVIDFGADWCGPCKVAEKKLKAYLAEHGDTAVRAVAMDGRTPQQTFALPVAKQHLGSVAGLPHFIVFGPDGKRVYKGPSVVKALAAIDKNRTQ